MHYFKDYLEILEPLHEIIRENLTLIHENDLKLENEFSKLEEDSFIFLKNYHFNRNQSLELISEQLINQQDKQIEYNKLIERYEQLLKITTNKITLANESHDFVERYYKKLENDLNKFKIELEADYSGLTETLEKRFANEEYNEHNTKTVENSIFNPSLLDLESLLNSFDDQTISNLLIDNDKNQSTLNYLTSQSRSLHNNLNSLSLFNQKQRQSNSRYRKRLQNSSTIHNIHKQKRNIINNSKYFHSNNQELSLNFNRQIIESIDERRYCFCNEMSYGDMIACDNPTCHREWFHYSCVGIIIPPKGKWFCDECIQIV